MSYILTKTNGATLTVVNDGSIDQTTNLKFVGKNYAGYGQIENENFLRLLENFSNNVSPDKPISGQLWYNVSSKKLNVFDGTDWKNLPFIETNETQPTNLTFGDFWFDTNTNELWVKNATGQFSFIGPSAFGSQGPNVIKVIRIKEQDTDLYHYALEALVTNEIVCIWSYDEYQVASDDDVYNTFPVIRKGVNTPKVTTQDISAGDEYTSGAITGQWTLVGNSTLEATYADLAERYAADKFYEEGTVLVIGGEREVTVTSERAATSVAGIVSKNPAFKLNAEAGTDDTHPYIALKGRVPCKVVGPVRKGDRLVSSRAIGHAEVFQMNDSPSAVLGIALETFNGGFGVIEVKV